MENEEKAKRGKKRFARFKLNSVVNSAGCYVVTYYRSWRHAKHQLFFLTLFETKKIPQEFIWKSPGNTVPLGRYVWTPSFAKFGISYYSIIHPNEMRSLYREARNRSDSVHIDACLCFRSAVWGAFPELRLGPLSSATLTLTTCGNKMWPIRVMKACLECFRTWNQINVNLMQLWNLCVRVCIIKPASCLNWPFYTHKKAQNTFSVEESSE